MLYTAIQPIYFHLFFRLMAMFSIFAHYALDFIPLDCQASLLFFLSLCSSFPFLSFITLAFTKLNSTLSWSEIPFQGLTIDSGPWRYLMDDSEAATLKPLLFFSFFTTTNVQCLHKSSSSHPCFAHWNFFLLATGGAPLTIYYMYDSTVSYIKQIQTLLYGLCFALINSNPRVGLKLSDPGM